MLDATAGFEQLAALVADAHIDTEALLGGEIVYNLVGEMVHIDDHAGEPGLLEPQDDTLDERLASHLDQRLGHGIGQWFEARTQSGGKNHCLHHSAKLRQNLGKEEER